MNFKKYFKKKIIPIFVILISIISLITLPIIYSIVHVAKSISNSLGSTSINISIVPTQNIFSKDYIDNLLSPTPILSPTSISSLSITQSPSPLFPKLSNKKFTSLKLPILMYHHIREIDSTIDHLGQRLSVTPKQFDNQMNELKTEGYSSISFYDLLNYINSKKELPKRSIIISFDDGYDDVYTNALPILKKYAFKGEFAIITGFVGKPSYMNWTQIKSLKAEGNDIVSHSVDHPDLSKLTLQRLTYELLESKKTLDTRLIQNTQFIIYPSGKYSPLVEDTASTLGYLLGRSTDNGETVSSDNLMRLPVLRMFDETNLKGHI